MAENKKSFVLYADLIKNIEHLTNEEKGILFNHLLEYVNDKKPILEDRLILTAWKPIEAQLKRDLVKFEEVKQKRSEAGKRSAELRALKIDEQTPTNPTSVESVKQTPTNPTDNVTVNVTVINIEERKQKFANSLKPYLQLYGADMLNDFYGYWTQHGENDKKFLAEKQKSFGIDRRLETWKRNEGKFGNKTKTDRL